MKLPLKILIAEDEAIIALGIQMELEMAGYGVCQIVATGEEAIKRVSQNPPDLVLMDNRLAGNMDGLEAARAILAVQRIPIIFMTGYAVEEIRQAASQLDPLGYLVKPIQMYDLEPLIESLVTE